MSEPESPTLDPQVLREMYRISIEEYRFAVSQNSDRQKFFVGLNVAVSSVVPSVFASGDDFGIMPTLILALAALTALLGIKVVGKSHEYYRNARSHFQHIEKRLGLDSFGLGLGTTPGMDRDDLKSRGLRFKVYRAVQWLLGVLLLFDIAAAFLLWP